MFKRLFDFLLSLTLLLIFSPIMLLFSFLIWIQDRKIPFYVAQRVGKNAKLFYMIKFRSMILNADKSGVDSTSKNDTRITPLGHIIRKYKIDELPNFINIFFGQMSFVGPRPNVKRETDLYTNEEKKLLSLRPGMTDFSSIIFSDEGDILANSNNPDLDYNQLIRPWKSRLGLLYVEKRTLFIDIKLIINTAFAIISKKRALKVINKMLNKLNADKKLVKVCLRDSELFPHPPPGSNNIVTSRN